MHLVCDGHGIPLAATVTAGQAHESKQVEAVLGGVKLRRRRGLAYGIAYTWSKTMMYTGFPHDTNNPFFKKWFYGPTFNGAPHGLTANYTYDLPGLGKKFNIKPLGWITDNWAVSGITSWQSHALVGVPGISMTGTSSSNPAPQWTGSPDGARGHVSSPSDGR